MIEDEGLIFHDCWFLWC